MNKTPNKINENLLCSECNSYNLTKVYFDDRIEKFCDCGFEKDYLIGENYFKNEDEVDKAEGLICRCGSKKFYIDLKAFISNIEIDNFKNIINFDINNIEFDFDTYIEYCYCKNCGEAINYN